MDGTSDRQLTGEVTVLFVSPDADFADVFALRLGRIDDRIDVESVPTAAAARETFDPDQHDCVVLASELGDDPAIQLLADLRDDAPAIPGIVYASRSGGNLVTKAIDAGATDVIHRRLSGDHYELVANRIVGAVLAYRDRQRASIARKRLERAHDRHDQGYVAVDDEWVVTHWSEQVADLTGIGRDAAIGERFWHVLDCETTVHEAFERAKIRDEAATVEVSRPEGDLSLEAVPDDRGLSIYVDPVRGDAVGEAFSLDADDGARVATADSERDDLSPEPAPDDRHTLEALYQIAAADVPVEERATRLLAFGSRRLGLDAGALVRVDGEDCTVRAAHVRTDGSVVQSFPLSGTNCQRMLDADGTVAWTDGDRGDVTVGYLEAPVAASITTPIDVDGEFYGMLGFASRAGREHPFSEVETVFVELLGEWVSHELERQRDHERLQEQKALFEGVFRDVPDAMVMADENRRIVKVNRAAEDLFGYDAATLRGESTERLYASESEFERMGREYFSSDANNPYGTTVVEYEHATGERLLGEIVGTPLQGPNDDLLGYLAAIRDVTDQVAFEATLQTLQQTARDLMVAETRSDVVSIALDAAELFLDQPLAALWWHDESRPALVPAGATAVATDVVGDQPVFEPGESVAWETFRDGSMHVFTDVSEQDGTYNAETTIGSEIQIPLGEYGLLVVADEHPDAFSEQDVELVRILAANVESALRRAEREQQLRSREQELARQNERLDEFASIVAHDLRSPLSVATGYLELAAESDDPEHFDRVTEALERMEAIIEDVLALARLGDTISETEPVGVGHVAQEAWGHVETPEATLSILDEDASPIMADPDRLAQLFENLFRNAVEHGGADAAVRVGVSHDGFYVEDDGPGIPPEHRDEVFEHGYSTQADGTGFGLSIVHDIVAAHGWEITVTDGADGGACFEVTGVRDRDEE